LELPPLNRKDLLSKTRIKTSNFTGCVTNLG
jgi:hypothetical protein